jgi:uncharacterized repeat protein (TIGR01451 family)
MSSEREDESSESEREQERTDQGSWAALVTLLVVGTGIAMASPLLVAAATVPLWYVAASTFGSAGGSEVRLTRELTQDGGSVTVSPGTNGTDDESVVTGDPGERVTVRTTVTNTGSTPISDLRLVDGVPDGLPVISGTPRTCVTLKEGETATLEYEVELRRGEHTFGTAEIRTRGVVGTVAESWAQSVEGDEMLRCLPVVETVPLTDGTNDYAGSIPTDDGGSGVEFYSIRKYEPGDSIGAIDWRRYANVRELATVEYRAERATRVACLVDTRINQLRAPSEEQLPALELSVAAARRSFETLLDAGHQTGIVSINDLSITTLPPGTGAETRQRGLEMLSAMRDRDVEVEEFGRLRNGNPPTQIPHELPGEAQVFLFSAFTDDMTLSVVEQLRMRGYPVCVISPAITGESRELALRVESVARQTRLSQARANGAHVIDWDLGDPIGPVLSKAVREVSSR